MKSFILTLLFSLLLLEAYAANILVLGDSQSEGPFGTELFLILEKSPFECSGEPKAHKVNFYATSSSSPRHWGAQAGKSNAKWLCKRKWRHQASGETQTKTRHKEDCKIAKKANISMAQYLVDKHNPDKIIFQFLGNTRWWMNRALKLGEKGAKAYMKKFVGPYIKDLTAPTLEKECLFIISNPNHISQVQRNRVRVELSKAFQYLLAEHAPHCKIIDGMDLQMQEELAPIRAHFRSDRNHLSSLGAKVFSSFVESQLCEGPLISPPAND